MEQMESLSEVMAGHEFKKLSKVADDLKQEKLKKQEQAALSKISIVRKFVDVVEHYLYDHRNDDAVVGIDVVRSPSQTRFQCLNVKLVLRPSYAPQKELLKAIAAEFAKKDSNLESFLFMLEYMKGWVNVHVSRHSLHWNTYTIEFSVCIDTTEQSD